MVRFILNSGSEKEIKSSFTNQEAPIDIIEPLELRYKINDIRSFGGDDRCIKINVPIASW